MVNLQEGHKSFLNFAKRIMILIEKWTEKTFETIVSVLINSKIDAEKNNKDGINNAYIESINNALEELKTIKR